MSRDVFETLLHRNCVSKPDHVRFVARQAAAMLAEERGIRPDVEATWRARTEVQSFAYRALDMLNPGGEVRFRAFMADMAILLNLQPEDSEILRAQKSPSRGAS